MKATIVRPRDLGAAELAAWREIQRRSVDLGNPFLFPEFALAVDRVRSDARVAVIEDAGETAAFLAFQQGRVGIARPIGAGVSDQQALIHSPESDFDVGALLAASGISVWEFDHLVGSQLGRVGGDVRAVPSPVIDVSNGYGPYLAERQCVSKKIIKSTLAKHRRLEREVGPIRFEFDAHDRATLELLMRWKSAQYRRTGRRDRFAVEWIEQLIWELFEGRPEGRLGVLSVLWAADSVAAAHFGLRGASMLSCWFPAYDVELAPYSPGLQLHLKMTEGAAAAGIRRLDLGKGGEDYKQSLKTGDLVVGEGWSGRAAAVTLGLRIARFPRALGYRALDEWPTLRRLARRSRAAVGRLRALD
jgi:CelD/BcsL family acetyltransferase involved in cellulose biosynthesis